MNMKKMKIFAVVILLFVLCPGSVNAASQQALLEEFSRVFEGAVTSMKNEGASLFNRMMAKAQEHDNSVSGKAGNFFTNMVGKVSEFAAENISRSNIKSMASDSLKDIRAEYDSILENTRNRVKELINQGLDVNEAAMIVYRKAEHIPAQQKEARDALRQGQAQLHELVRPYMEDSLNDFVKAYDNFVVVMIKMLTDNGADFQAIRTNWARSNTENLPDNHIFVKAFNGSSWLDFVLAHWKILLPAALFIFVALRIMFRRHPASK